MLVSGIWPWIPWFLAIVNYFKEQSMPKLLLIAPRWGKEIMRNHFQFPPLGLAMVAAVTPPDFEVQIVDENVEPLDPTLTADIVGLTAMTCQVTRAYRSEERRVGKE